MVDTPALHFIDFAYTDLDGGRIKIDPGWVEENIVTVGIPQLAGRHVGGGFILLDARISSIRVTCLG